MRSGTAAPLSLYLAAIIVAVCANPVQSADAAPSRRPALELKPGDHICLVGNSLGERLQMTSDWEALLYTRFPELDLVVRNLCFPADEPYRRDRSLNFGTPDAHLTHSKADVILFFFGSNEAFRGAGGRDDFERDLRKLIEETKTKDYSGKGPPRMVLVSPIAHEDLEDPNVATGAEHNEQLALYTELMRNIAAANGIGFVDLFTPSRELFATSPKPLTINGLHLNNAGYRALAPMLDEGLFGPRPQSAKASTALHEMIAEKNFHWFHRYRAVNGYSIYGTRGEAGSDGTYRNREVMERERAILDEMCANRDERIWQLARGQEPAGPIDDSNTLPFIVPKTNVGGADDPNRKAGKLGSLDYLPAAEQQKMFRLAPGYEIQLVASEEQFPELANPVALNFDSRGRLWVATMPSYPQWQPKTPMNDKLLILEDVDGDGRADQCKTFAGGLHQPTGFELGHGGVFIAQQPDLLFLKDTDGDDRADVRERRLSGFDSADSHHGLAAFEWGPDGALYFQEGTFKQSQVETPYGPVRLGDAGVWRYEPRTERFEVHVSLTFANPWGHVFDPWGQNFLADASPGFNYWATPISGFVPHPDKHPGGCRDQYLDWGGPKSNKHYPVFIPMRIRPSSGCEFVSSRHFPPEAQGDFLVNNVIGDLGILQHKVREEGAGFSGEETTPLLLSDHGNFRPVDLQFGPDGALYIVDWHNALIGHLQHNLREPHRDHSHGRIWRITYPSRPLLKAPVIAGASIPALLDLLKEPEDRTRYRVRRELAERPTSEVLAALEPWIAERLKAATQEESQAALQHKTHNDQAERLLLESLWLYQTHNVVNADLLARVLASPDHRARAAAVRVLVAWRDRLPHTLDLISACVHDAHPRVRLEAVRACSFIHSPQSFELALEVVDKEMDYYLEYTLDETLRVLETLLQRDVPIASTQPAAHGDEHGSEDHTDDHADHAAHVHGSGGPRPLLFLDKSPRSISYQIHRLTTSQLLAADRSSDDPRFIPLFSAILRRPDVSRQDRAEALSNLAKLTQSSPLAELIAAVDEVASASRTSDNLDDPTVRELAHLVLVQPVTALRDAKDLLRGHTSGERAAVRAAAWAALIASGDTSRLWEEAQSAPSSRFDFLNGLRIVPAEDVRNSLRAAVLASLGDDQPHEVRTMALRALAKISAEPEANFQSAAGLVGSDPLRATAVQTMLSVPRLHRGSKAAQRVLNELVTYAEATPAERRTTNEFLDAMQLADELLATLSAEEARQLRERLRAITVRVVRINTVHEEMRYDTPYFAVEAGRPVQLVLRNEDLMPHNLVVTAPGSLRSVALAAADMPPQADRRGLTYVPETSDVLFATPLVPSHQQNVLTFTAPSEPGEYPYVCTLPNHWMRMYGVMVVVPDLDQWLANPVEPTDPLGNTRALVKNWTPEDFPNDLVPSLAGRSPEIGRKIYTEATCAQCHKLHGEGGQVGPDLSDVLARWKGDWQAVLREVLDPGHKIDPQYALYNIVTVDGRVLSGIVSDQNAETVTLVTNPDKPQPVTLGRDDIEAMTKASTSMMPKGLLDRYTADEIFELLALLVNEKAKKKE